MNNINYAEGLITPHPRKDVGDPPQELLALIAPQQFAEELQAISDPRDQEIVALAAATFIATQVAEALWFPERDSQHDDFADFDIEEPVTLDDLLATCNEDDDAAKQVADCFGFTVVTSECLQAAAIDHWVGFANGHATILLPSLEKGVVHLNDPLSPSLSQTLREAMLDGRYAIQDDMETSDHSVVMLNTLKMAREAKGGTFVAFKEHPWLVFNCGGAYAWEQSPLNTVPEQSNPKFRIMMRAFQPSLGRQALQFYQDLQKAIRADQYLEAAALVGEEGQLFPDGDARNPHNEVKAIAKDLGRRGYVEFGRRVLDAYFEPLGQISADSRFREAHGDCLRLLATSSGDKTSAELAAAKYREALASPKSYRQTVRGKLAKTQALLAD